MGDITDEELASYWEYDRVSFEDPVFLTIRERNLFSGIKGSLWVSITIFKHFLWTNLRRFLYMHNCLSACDFAVSRSYAFRQLLL